MTNKSTTIPAADLEALRVQVENLKAQLQQATFHCAEQVKRAEDAEAALKSERLTAEAVRNAAASQRAEDLGRRVGNLVGELEEAEGELDGARIDLGIQKGLVYELKHARRMDAEDADERLRDADEIAKKEKFEHQRWRANCKQWEGIAGKFEAERDTLKETLCALRESIKAGDDKHAVELASVRGALPGYDELISLAVSAHALCAFRVEDRLAKMAEQVREVAQ